MSRVGTREELRGRNPLQRAESLRRLEERKRISLFGRSGGLSSPCQEDLRGFSSRIDARTKHGFKLQCRLDATLTMLFSDEATEKIKRCIFRTIQLSTRTTKPYSFIGSRFLSLCFSSYVRNMRYNDDTLPRVKTICLTTNGASKPSATSMFPRRPSEVADFLECYNSLVASIGLNEHLHATFSIPHFRCGLKSTNTSTRITAR